MEQIDYRVFVNGMSTMVIRNDKSAFCKARHAVFMALKATGHTWTNRFEVKETPNVTYNDEYIVTVD